MRASVLGAGQAGMATAAYLRLRGHHVDLWNRSGQRLWPIMNRGGIELTGVISGTASVRCHTNLTEAITGSDVVVITTTATAHEDVAKALHARGFDGTAVLLPGRTGGASEFLSVCPSATVVEAQSVPFACRSTDGATVRVLGVKSQVPAASPTGQVPAAVMRLLPTLIQAQSVMHTSLNNIGCVLHPALFLASLRQDRPGRLYTDLDRRTEQTVLGIDEERLRIAAAHSVPPVSLSEWLVRMYPEARGDSLREILASVPAYRNITAPVSVPNRFLTEDVPTGLVPMASYAQRLGIPTPHIDATIDEAIHVTGHDWRLTGRNAFSLALPAGHL